MSFFCLTVLWLGICVEKAVDWISRISVYPLPPPPLHLHLSPFLSISDYFLRPSQNALSNTSDSYLKSVRA